MSVNEHDLIVIGAGPAGDFAATLAAKEGLDVAQIERENVGGECAYWGCMPSKALLRPGELHAEVGRVPGVPGAEGRLDPAAILARRDEVINGLDDGPHADRQIRRGIHLYRGQGRLGGEREVSVRSDGGEPIRLTARRAVFIATGTRADLPPIPGLAEASPWTNREATTATTVPESLIVMGGGPVGCEMAQAWNSLGAEVTLLEATPSLIPDAEPFARGLLERSLSEQGIDVRTGVRASDVHRDDGTGPVTVTLEDGSRLTAAELLVGIGRAPNTEDLGLDSVDLATGVSIGVNDRMQVPRHEEWLYAVGDVNGRAQLTHAAKYQAQIAIANLMNREASATWDGALSPQVVFTEPQIAWVGDTLESALASGVSAVAVDADPGRTPGASFVGKGGHSGARIVVDTQREVLVGATFVGPEVAEWLQAATFALVGEIPLRRLAHAMAAYPTRSEAWLELLADWRP